VIGRGRGAAALLAVGLAISARSAWADDTCSEPRGVTVRAARIDEVAPPDAARSAELASTAADLGSELALALSDAGIDARFEPDGAAADGCRLVVTPHVASAGARRAALRIELRKPPSAVVWSREGEVDDAALQAQGVLFLRDLIEAGAIAPDARALRPEPGVVPTLPAAPVAPSPSAPPSDGTTVLAIGSTILGGFTGLGVYSATGAEDPRILYPTLAAGAAIGLGGSLLVAGEWDVTSADAWFLLAGGLWPTAAGHLLYEGRFAERHPSRADQERWTFGLVGTTTGLGLSALAISLRRPTEGDAALVHSGAAYGTLLGALTEIGVTGDLDALPEAGMGYGAAAGWLAAGTLSLSTNLAPRDVLALDLGIALGGLGGAALASPLVFDAPSENAQRAFVAITAGSTVVGAAVGWWVGRDALGDGDLGRPTAGVIGESVLGSRRAPVYGAAYARTLP
jgi:hypothetical protein